MNDGTADDTVIKPELEAKITLATHDLLSKGATAVILMVCHGEEVALSFHGDGEHLVGMMALGEIRMQRMIRSGMGLVNVNAVSKRSH